MHLWLIGMMGSGKTTVGRLVAAAAGVEFHDVDLVVAQRRRTSIPELWEREGEDTFRALEATVIEELSTSARAVISTGGGAILREANRRAMRRSGTVVWLQASPDVLARRVGGGAGRPVLAEGSTVARLAELIDARHNAYAATAHHIISTEDRTPGDVAEEVRRWL
jgi:shikimate kinase